MHFIRDWSGHNKQEHPDKQSIQMWCVLQGFPRIEHIPQNIKDCHFSDTVH